MAAIAKNQNQGVIQSLIEGLARRLDDMSGQRFGDWLKDSTGLTPLPSFLSQPNFGVVQALHSTRTPPSLGDMLIETVNYAIEEARERLAALVKGDFIPGGVQDLYDYLKSQSFDLETRINKLTGEVVNYLVDRNSKQAVPAAQVDPSLSQKNVLALELRGRLREQIGGDTPVAAFGSWAGMAWTRDSIESKFGYTVDRDRAYFGRVLGIVSDNAESNQALFAQCAEKQIELIVPRNAEGDPIVGMPVLAKIKSLPAEQVDVGLDYKIMSAKFGGSMVEHYVELAKKLNGPAANAARAERISKDEFSKLFLKQEKDIVPTGDAGFGFSSPVEEMDIVIKQTPSGNYVAFDRAAREEIPYAINCLPYGEYERYDRQEKLSGFTTVGDKGVVTHYDENHREVPKELPRMFRRVEDRQPAPTMSMGFA